MGDAVKKSRIVSEENLEESLMEEFNIRLKSCMTQVCIVCLFLVANNINNNSVCAINKTFYRMN